MYPLRIKLCTSYKDYIYTTLKNSLNASEAIGHIVRSLRTECTELLNRDK